MTNALKTFGVRLFSFEDGELETKYFETSNAFTAAFLAGMTMGTRWLDSLGFLSESPYEFLTRVHKSGTFAMTGEDFAKQDDEILLWNVDMYTPTGVQADCEFQGRDVTSAAADAGISYVITWFEDRGFLTNTPEQFLDLMRENVTIHVSPKDIDVNEFLREPFGE